MEIQELRQKFLDYFSSQGYKQHPASSLIPENDPSVLFTTAGMQQFKNFYTEPTEAPAERLTTVQPVVRTSDIAEVGDETHLTMFEMLGIFSFGEKSSPGMKERAIKDMWQFIEGELRIEKGRVYATVFKGDKDIPRDEEAAAVWRELGVEVRDAGREDNFWGPTGEQGPCGPTSEIHVDGIEVGNLVFNQYFKDKSGRFTPLKNVGLDFGSGLERLAATLQQKTSVWLLEPYQSWAKQVDASGAAEARVIADHVKAITFLVSAGIQPGNKGRDYVLRRLIRKAVFLSRRLPQSTDWAKLIAKIHQFYKGIYPLMTVEEISEILEKEKAQFEKNLARAVNYLDNWLKNHAEHDEKSITELAFYLYESFGFPKELVIEHLVSLGWGVDTAHFAELFRAHQEVSRAGLAGQFKGGLADHNEKTIKHHTAHHLLLAALRQVLGPAVVQKGSNVTSERLRLDFNFERKLTEAELKEVEQIVNDKIQENLPVVMEQLPKEEALRSGALAEFGQKYGDEVTVYSIGDFSKELCGGPHVEKTGQLGRFEILKEEASSQGVRRIKARLTEASAKGVV